MPAAQSMNSPALARDYFPSLDALQDCVRKASSRACTPGEKKFTTKMGDRAMAYGLMAYMSSTQASKLATIAARPVSTGIVK